MNMNTSFKTLALVVVLVMMSVALQLPGIQGTLQAQSNLKKPVVTQKAILTVQWTAGTLLNGGHGVAITAGSAALTANNNDCSAPGYAACDFLFATSGGVVAVTTTSGTAIASGTTLLAIIETNSTTISRLAFPYQTDTPHLTKN